LFYLFFNHIIVNKKFNVCFFCQAIKVIMGIDAAGVVMGWKLFDHAAHLGGALFGM
jgi:hypothetical protein